MKKKYVTPEMEVVEIEVERILAGSGETTIVDVYDGEITNSYGD